jgi:hypothetical protein
VLKKRFYCREPRGCTKRMIGTSDKLQTCYRDGKGLLQLTSGQGGSTKEERGEGDY